MSDNDNTQKEQQIKSVFDIRYIKLHFTIEYMEDSVMPKYKASSLRGGMGEMLLRANCIRDRQCEDCDFESECLIRRIMYSRMDIQPAFMSSGDRIGYVVECEDYREEFRRGDRTDFSLILFGKTICYFSQIINALYALGMNGLGKNKSRFSIISITNSKRIPIMNGSDIDMSKYEVSTVSDYITFRHRQIDSGGGADLLKFQSPTSIKYRQQEITEFDINAIVEAACRRIYMLDCFEGIESNLTSRDYQDTLQIPEVLNEYHHQVSVKRYSNHKKSAMYLHGIEGELALDQITGDLLNILIAGELVHIGKNTSFGFGRYRIMQRGNY